MSIFDRLDAAMEMVDMSAFEVIDQAGTTEGGILSSVSVKTIGYDGEHDNGSLNMDFDQGVDTVFVEVAMAPHYSVLYKGKPLPDGVQPIVEVKADEFFTACRIMSDVRETYGKGE